MSQFTTRLEVTPLADGRKWKVIRTFQYDVGHLGSGNTITIPAGFITDFASSPRIFWPIVSPWGKWGKAAIIHDYLYQNQRVKDRMLADSIFLEAMIVLGVVPWRRQLMYWGVRLFGRLAWQNKKEVNC